MNSVRLLSVAALLSVSAPAWADVIDSPADSPADSNSEEEEEEDKGCATAGGVGASAVAALVGLALLRRRPGA